MWCRTSSDVNFHAGERLFLSTWHCRNIGPTVYTIDGCCINVWNKTQSSLQVTSNMVESTVDSKTDSPTEVMTRINSESTTLNTSNSLSRFGYSLKAVPMVPSSTNLRVPWNVFKHVITISDILVPHDLSTARLAVLGHFFVFIFVFTDSLLEGKSDRAWHVIREIGRGKHYWGRRKRQVCWRLSELMWCSRSCCTEWWNCDFIAWAWSKSHEEGLERRW